MSDPEKDMIDAYRKQERIYNRILELVRKQETLINGDGEFSQAGVVKLCERVEERLEDIAELESSIRPAKQEWMEQDGELSGNLEQVLERIADTIEQTRALQFQVQKSLSDRVPAKQSDVAGAGSNPGTDVERARRAYKSV